MHAPGPFGLILILLIVIVFFGGKGKLSSIMTDLAQGIKGFKKGLADDEPASDAPRVSDGSTIDAKIIDKDKV